jgi:xylulokinase
VRSSVRQVIAEAGIRPADVAGIAIAAQVDSVVPVDASNAPLAPALVWLDRRAVAEARLLEEAIGATALREITGLNPDAAHGGPKVAWLAAHLPGPADGYLAPTSFIVADLSGERVVDHANASSSLLYDIRRRDWSPLLLETLEIETLALGRLAPAVDVAGRLSDEAALDLGLTTSCVVAVGTGDEHAACVAAGALQPGIVADIAGTAEPVASAASEPLWDEAGLVETHAHVPVDRWLVENPGFLAGGSVRWLADAILGCEQADVEALAAGAPPGSDGVLFIPALSGSTTPRWDEGARGVFSGLALNHDRRHLARAVLEGCAFAVRDIVDRLAELGLGSGTLRVVGGGARNRLALQIRADVTGRRVEAPREPEATGLGAALVTGVAAGWYRDLDEAAAATRDPAPFVAEPIPANAEVYADAYDRYRATFDAVVSTFPRSIAGSPVPVAPGSSR